MAAFSRSPLRYGVVRRMWVWTCATFESACSGKCFPVESCIMTHHHCDHRKAREQLDLQSASVKGSVPGYALHSWDSSPGGLRCGQCCVRKRDWISCTVGSTGSQLHPQTVDPTEKISSPWRSVYLKISVTSVCGASVLSVLSVQREPYSIPDFNCSYLTRHCQCNTLNARQ